MLFVLFLVVVYLLTAFQTAHYLLEETVQQRTAAVRALQAEIKERNGWSAKLALNGWPSSARAAGVPTRSATAGSITLNLDSSRRK